jgi:hypothetical protein
MIDEVKMIRLRLTLDLDNLIIILIIREMRIIIRRIVIMDEMIDLKEMIMDRRRDGIVLERREEIGVIRAVKEDGVRIEIVVDRALRIEKGEMCLGIWRMGCCLRMLGLRIVCLENWRERRRILV